MENATVRSTVLDPRMNRETSVRTDDDVSGIWCYQCNSAYHEECATIKPNDTTSKYYKSCHPEEKNVTEMFCRKLVQKSSCLECYHCSGKIAADCRDPFPPESNATGLVNCSTLRTRGLNVLNIYNSLLQNVTAFKALGPEPHVCYKLYGPLEQSVF
uniref:Uncharacterized protein n=1 Tax=Rhodnius prolixus TaxID=13249 RepID=T1HC86_RHOPR